MSIAPGSYVTYKGVPHVVTVDFGDSVKLATHKSNTAPRASYKSVEPLDIQPAVLAKNEINGKYYVVTAKNNIFSLASSKLMRWGSNNGNRKSILGNAKITRFKINEGVYEGEPEGAIADAKCGRCNGVGYIPAYKSYNKGVCYRCHGKGSV